MLVGFAGLSLGRHVRMAEEIAVTCKGTSALGIVGGKHLPQGAGRCVRSVIVDVKSSVISQYVDLTR